ncbi:uncharacterized protein LOC118269222 isoform X4 [Spodoptera frugiperda]|uniref:Uncharacterized protein LOC118269222 isoform X4 n=1 Tax=Spodoptera frugiperda TaxID=7108 RepID=A0A9R0D4P4_SPOFR|nr:uncharacterized protein LOC118269222 isoform X4 [Spodoptera frugiperda]
MAGKSVSFYSHCNLCDTNLEVVAKWLSCNGEIWGVGPTAVFASAAALFLYNELESTVFVAGDQTHVSWLEKTLISTMVLGMLALMIHLWVCSMRFFQYYLDTLIRDSPSVLLEMTTASLLGGQAEIMPLGPLTRFLRQQQPQIHMTVCWFLSLCYADYVRKNYCQRFNMPYLEQWQTELHSRAVRGLHSTVEKVNSFVGSVHQRLRGFVPPGHMEACPMTDCTTYTGSASCKKSSVNVSDSCSRVSWGDRQPSDSAAALSKPQKDFGVRLVPQSDETAVDAIEKLKNYVASTRCTCHTPDAGVVSTVSDKETKS